jgi:hypothetical protein
MPFLCAPNNGRSFSSVAFQNKKLDKKHIPHDPLFSAASFQRVSGSPLICALHTMRFFRCGGNAIYQDNHMHGKGSPCMSLLHYQLKPQFGSKKNARHVNDRKTFSFFFFYDKRVSVYFLLCFFFKSTSSTIQIQSII